MTSSDGAVTYLTLDVLERVHATLEERAQHGEPIPPWRDADLGKLESAIRTCEYVFGGEEMYPTLHAKAAVLLYSIAKAHALGNGNKRMALISTLVFLAINGRWWGAESEEARAHLTWVAASEARLRHRVLEYMTEYFETRLITWEGGAGG